MTKSSPAVPASAAPAAKPYAVTVFGPTTMALQEVAAHVRNGYVPDINTAIQVFGAAGTISIVLVLGDPDKAYIERAAVTTADAVAMEEARFNRMVEEAAARQIKAAADAEKATRRAAMLAEHAIALAKLTGELVEFDAK
jgi:hypothetical protein